MTEASHDEEGLFYKTVGPCSQVYKLLRDEAESHRAHPGPVGGETSRANRRHGSGEHAEGDGT